MKKSNLWTTVKLGSLLLLVGCASNPNKIPASYVSPFKYKAYDCDQIIVEMDYVSKRTVRLFNSLEKDHKNDQAQMGVGLLLFWPTLFFLEGGDGPEAAQYADLKGEFEALRQASRSYADCSVRWSFDWRRASASAFLPTTHLCRGYCSTLAHC